MADVTGSRRRDVVGCLATARSLLRCDATKCNVRLSVRIYRVHLLYIASPSLKLMCSASHGRLVIPLTSGYRTVPVAAPCATI